MFTSPQSKLFLKIAIGAAYTRLLSPQTESCFLLISALVTALTLGPSARLAAATPTVTNVNVNQALAGPFLRNKQNEPSLAQNPTKPLNLIAGSNDEIGLPACTNATPSSCPFTDGVAVSGFYASFDGGQTWPCQGVIDLSAFGEYAFGDPSQAFDSRGNAYYGTVAFPNSVTATHDQLATGLHGMRSQAVLTVRKVVWAAEDAPPLLHQSRNASLFRVES